MDQVAAEPRVRALFIGVNGTNSKLCGCGTDVTAMLVDLRVQCAFQDMHFENRILVDDSLLPGKMPTKGNINEGINWLVHDQRRGDALFFFYSGHGRQVLSLNGNFEKDGLDEAICALDGDIKDDDLFKLLAGRVHAGVRLTCVFDCCHSGTIMDLPFELVGHSGHAARDRLHMSGIRSNNFTAGDVVVFSACADSQTSVEVPNTADFGNGNRGAGGAATQAFLWALANAYGLPLGEVVLKMRAFLAKKGYEQVPQLSSSRRIDLSMPFSLFGPLEVEQPLVHYVPQQYASQFLSTNKARFKAPYTSPVAASRIRFGARHEGPRQLQGDVPQQPGYQGAHRQSRSSSS
ncbi:metacaspase 5, putative [Bodo saltans]|uniref:Metacaspase 5, putative n=1 Tax=Bodo saltans TaxID=75058 RepID=A0A0S4IS06_BODSA|nr:metacaspase 5, putative [Bodo saltans]|eukprot:CUF48713.1 metacaspase 5, putative [Bodo saltans]